jgi:hypothetical protein
MRHPTGTTLAVFLLTAACGGPAEDTADTPVAGAPTLRASVGTEESPDAFEIALLDENDDPVIDLPAGEYNIEVSDPTDIHNFHLSGEGGAVDERTSPSGKTETVWVVTFEPGQYRYMCDPHPSMNARFTVR